MNISATLDGKSVRIVEMIPSQVVGSYYILYVNLSDNKLYMTEKDREEFTSSLATGATVVEISDIAYNPAIEDLDMNDFSITNLKDLVAPTLADCYTATTVYIPSIMRGNVLGTGDWTTVLNIANLGSGAATVNVAIFLEGGGLQETIGPLSIPVNGSTEVGASIIADDNDYSAVITSDQPVVAVVRRHGPNHYNTQVTGDYRGVYEIGEAVGEEYTYYLPYLIRLSATQQISRMHIQNCGGELASIDVKFYTNSTGVLAHTQEINDLDVNETNASLAPGALGEWTGSGVVVSNQPLAIVIDTMAKPDGVDLGWMSSYTGVPANSDLIGLSHQAPFIFDWYSGWASYCSVCGTGGTPTVQSKNLDSVGGQHTLEIQSLVANGSISFNYPVVYDLSRYLQASTEVSANNNVALVVRCIAPDSPLTPGMDASGFAYNSPVVESIAKVILPLITKGITGISNNMTSYIAIKNCNLNSGYSVVKVSLYGANGTLTGQYTISLTGQYISLFTLSDWGEVSDDFVGSVQVEIERTTQAGNPVLGVVAFSKGAVEEGDSCAAYSGIPISTGTL